MELLTTENLTFLLPLVAAVLMVLSMGLGMPMSEHGAHVHAHVDVQAGPDAHVGQVGEMGNVSTEHGHGSAGSGGGDGVAHGVLGFLGIGKVPFAVVIVSVCLVWGVTGLVLGLVALKWTLGLKMATSGVAALLGTNLVGSGLSRVLPEIETYCVTTEALVNERAEVIHEVTQSGGVARLVDTEGNLRDLACRAAPGGGVLARGTRVVLTSYDNATKRFVVTEQTGVGGASGMAGGAG